MHRYVITGGLGTGKTSVLSALDGWLLVVGEPAREIIGEHQTATGEPSLDAHPELFVDRLIERSIIKHQTVPDEATAVFDRGLPDCVAYAAVYGIDTRAAVAAANRYRYETQVFVAPPWEEIYTTDDMRTATYAQAEVFYSEVVAAYELLEYDMVELPKISVDERAAFITSHFS